MTKLRRRTMAGIVAVSVVISVLVFPYLRDQAMRHSFSVRIMHAVKGVIGNALHVEYELTYDTAKAGWLRWLAPQRVLVDKGLLSSSFLQGRRVEWLMPNGRTIPVGDWAGVNDTCAGREIVWLNSGEKLKAAVNAYPDEHKTWQEHCRIVVLVDYYQRCGGLTLWNPRFAFRKQIQGQRFGAVTVSIASPWACSLVKERGSKADAIRAHDSGDTATRSGGHNPIFGDAKRAITAFGDGTRDITDCGNGR
jgi:hypothetical protein